MPFLINISGENKCQKHRVCFIIISLPVQNLISFLTFMSKQKYLWQVQDKVLKDTSVINNKLTNE